MTIHVNMTAREDIAQYAQMLAFMSLKRSFIKGTDKNQNLHERLGRISIKLQHQVLSCTDRMTF